MLLQISILGLGAERDETWGMVIESNPFILKLGRRAMGQKIVVDG